MESSRKSEEEDGDLRVFHQLGRYGDEQGVVLILRTAFKPLQKKKKKKKFHPTYGCCSLLPNDIYITLNAL